MKVEKKKLKQRSFAASVNREDIEEGIEELAVDRNEHIQFVIDALKEKAEELGLAGTFTESNYVTELSSS